MGNTYTQHYSNFIGVDMSSDPRAVARNRLAYAENMWRDYESEQGEAIETFPGFRRLVRGLGAVHGLFAYRLKDSGDYLIVHAGTRLYSFRDENIAAMSDVALAEDAALKNVTLADADSTAFIFNNNLYILDGSHFIVVSSVTDKSGATSVTASEVDAYIPTTYFDGKPYEQRNMLVDESYEVFLEIKEISEPIKHNELLKIDTSDTAASSYIGFNDEWLSSDIVIVDASKRHINIKNFNGLKSVKRIYISVLNSLTIKEKTFQNLPMLEEVTIYVEDTESRSANIYIGTDQIGYIPPKENMAFYNCPNLKKIDLIFWDKDIGATVVSALPDSVDLVQIKGYTTDPDNADKFYSRYLYQVKLSEVADDITDITNYRTGESLRYIFKYENEQISGKNVRMIKEIFLSGFNLAYFDYSINKIAYDKNIKVHLKLSKLYFRTVENVKNFYECNPDYDGTGVEAINGCTKSAVFDGRIFLTGNSRLPNTVFYSNRNLTGANDPTYWGAYNYFNDGDGNTPNVDLLSTPSMLMVLKNNTVQDGSVYYHVAAYNDDEYSADLVPKIYPSTSGAAGLGSAGKTVPGTTACNFLDDPVFLSTRGLEAVGKQTVNLERTITHRSSNVDRLLIKEDLSRASLAEWKGYLVICCDGRFYLADSRQIHQHSDGSYQYEWYYLEGLGCYKTYSGAYEYLFEWPTVDDKGNSFGECTLNDGTKIKDNFSLASHNGMTFKNSSIEYVSVVSATKPDGESFYFYYDNSLTVPLALYELDGERKAWGDFYPAKKICVVGERLFFGTEGGDVCVINTDKRGVPDYEWQIFENNRISSRWYSFAGLRYPSICVTPLDNCSKPSLAKGTIPGTAVARFKMMPGSHLRVNVSLNGRDFKKIGEAFASRYDAGDFRFDNFSFTENEDSVVVLRELTRNWVDKQYSFVSDGFREPFGLYEISYLYTVKGKIRKTFALIDRKE